MTVCVTNAENNVCSGYELTVRTEDMRKASISISNWLGMMLQSTNGTSLLLASHIMLREVSSSSLTFFFF